MVDNDDKNKTSQARQNNNKDKLGGRASFSRRTGSWLWGAVLACMLPVAGAAESGLQAAAPHTLPGLMARAMGVHPVVLSRRVEVDAARVDVEAARLQYYPAPSAQMAQDSGGTLTTLRLTQPLWLGGRLEAGLEAAQARARVAGEALQEARQQIALRVVAQWQAWQAAHERAAAIRRGLELLGLYAQSVERRIAGGFAAEADQQLVLARIHQTQGDLAAAQAQERSARSQLAQSAGIALGAEDLAPVLPAGQMPGRPSGSLDALLQAALEADPALQRLNREIEAARAEARQKEALQWPAVNLVGQHSEGTNAGVNVREGRILVTLEYAPGAGLSTAHAVRAALTRVAAQEQSREARRLELVDAIAADFEELAALEQRQAGTAAAIAANRAVLDSYDRQFAASRKSWLEVINAAREFTQTETAAADIAAALVGARWRLDIRTGRVDL